MGFKAIKASTVQWTIGVIILIAFLFYIMIYFRDPGRDIPVQQWWLSAIVIGINVIGLVLLITYSYSVSLDVLEERDESQDIKSAIKDSLQNVALVSALILSISIPMLQCDHPEDRLSALAFMYASSMMSSSVYAASATCLSAFAILYFGQLPTNAVASFIMKDPRIVGYPLLSLVASVTYLIIGIILWFLIEYGYVMACTATSGFMAGIFIVYTFTLQISNINADKLILEFPIQPSPEELRSFLTDYFGDIFVAKGGKIREDDAWLYGSLGQFTCYVLHRKFLEDRENDQKHCSAKNTDVEIARFRLERQSLKRTHKTLHKNAGPGDSKVTGSEVYVTMLDSQAQLTPITRMLIHEIFSKTINSKISEQIPGEIQFFHPGRETM
jgi:hypothetical protein